MLCWVGSCVCHAQNVVLHLKNGDRITGRLVADKTNELIVATAFSQNLVIPGNLIERKEVTPLAPPAPAPAQTNPPPAVAVVAPTNPPSSPATGIMGELVLTNKPSMAHTAGGAAPPPEAKPEPPKPSEFRKFLSEWRGEAQLGANLGFSTKDREAFTGRIKLTHSKTLPKSRALRNILDYDVSYGTSDNVVSDNRMEGAWKTEYDLNRRFLVYNVARAGYDEVRGIDFQYDFGPGLGYKWVVLTNFVFKNEVGGDYQEQYFAHDKRSTRYSMRLAEDLWWQITPKIRWDERIEFFPDVQDLSTYRLRLETSLSYLLKQNLTLSLNLVDLYDTSLPEGVSKNDLQIRSLLGIRF